MKTVVLPDYNKNVLRALLSLKITDIEIPELKDNEVLIKTSSSVCNPSDIAFIQGVYNIVKPVPAIPGFEGAGEIVKEGKNVSGLAGKKVSAFVQSNSSGTWSEYFVAKTTDIILLDQNMPEEQAACFTVNPFTAYGMFERAKQLNTPTIIQNASGSQVAAFLRKMAEEEGMQIIDIVRKEETAKILRGEGAKHVLVESDENFDDQLKQISSELKPRMAYDAVGGPLSGKIYNSLSQRSEMMVYGGLSNKPMSELNVMGAIFHNKIVSGFNLIDWKSGLSQKEFDRISLYLQKKFIDGIYKTKIDNTVDIDNILSGLKSYLGNMSAGKLLIKP